MSAGTISPETNSVPFPSPLTTRSPKLHIIVCLGVRAKFRFHMAMSFDYSYSIYILNLVSRSIGKFFRNRLVSGGSCRFKISSFGCTLRRLL
jgi:hypothetical protein